MIYILFWKQLNFIVKIAKFTTRTIIFKSGLEQTNFRQKEFMFNQRKLL